MNLFNKNLLRLFEIDDAVPRDKEADPASLREAKPTLPSNLMLRSHDASIF